MKKIGRTEYTTFNDLWNDKDFLNNEDKARIEFEAALIGKLIEVRDSKGVTQQELAQMTGLKQSAIARLESMKSTPQIDTLFKILKPLGYTLAIVPDPAAEKRDILSNQVLAESRSVYNHKEH
jgi:transcriptional regulator with XRE-family HTH domain